MEVQQLVYTLIISYKENGACRTIRTNEVMKLIVTISDHIKAEIKKGLTIYLLILFDCRPAVPYLEPFYTGNQRLIWITIILS